MTCCASQRLESRLGGTRLRVRSAPEDPSRASCRSFGHPGHLCLDWKAWKVAAAWARHRARHRAFGHLSGCRAFRTRGASTPPAPCPTLSLRSLSLRSLYALSTLFSSLSLRSLFALSTLSQRSLFALFTLTRRLARRHRLAPLAMPSRVEGRLDLGGNWRARERRWVGTRGPGAVVPCHAPPAHRKETCTRACTQAHPQEVALAVHGRIVRMYLCVEGVAGAAHALVLSDYQDQDGMRTVSGRYASACVRGGAGCACRMRMPQISYLAPHSPPPVCSQSALFSPVGCCFVLCCSLMTLFCCF